jgi:aminoglycoside 3-N-acetyltransferase
LIEAWRQSGLANGEPVLIHSSLGRILAATVLHGEAVLAPFLDVVGHDGTLLLPLFNYDFCQRKAFDMCHTL